MRPCSTTHVFHYLRPDADPGSVDSIVRRGLLPLSAMPEHPQHALQTRDEPDHFERRYEELAAPLLGRPPGRSPGRFPGGLPGGSNAGSGVFFTTVDFRRMPGSPLGRGTRIALPWSRLDPERTVVTYELNDQRHRMRLSGPALEALAEIWTAPQLERWLGAHPKGYFFHVPQVIAFQPGGVPITRADIDP